MISPPEWDPEQLKKDGARAKEHFRELRYREPLEVYLEVFDEWLSIVEEFLEETVDLMQLESRALDILTDEKKLYVFRYLAGPPVSSDDLKILAQAESLAPTRLREEPETVERLISFMRDWHDRRRFPWVHGGWEPSEQERDAAILATTALLAMRRVAAMRRNEGKEIQEELVAAQLRRTGLEQVEPRKIRTLAGAPGPGSFCRESELGGRKADFVIGLWDGRTMPLECKVSNSSINSIKRLNNDAAVKAETWKSDFGTVQVVPAAVLSGVYDLRHLKDAQHRGLTIFWAHDLRKLVDWIHKTDIRASSAARRAADERRDFGSDSN